MSLADLVRLQSDYDQLRVAQSSLELRLSGSISRAGGPSPAHSLDRIRVEHIGPQVDVGKGA